MTFTDHHKLLQTLSIKPSTFTWLIFVDSITIAPPPPEVPPRPEQMPTTFSGNGVKEATVAEERGELNVMFCGTY